MCDDDMPKMPVDDEGYAKAQFAELFFTALRVLLALAFFAAIIAGAIWCLRVHP